MSTTLCESMTWDELGTEPHSDNSTFPEQSIAFGGECRHGSFYGTGFQSKLGEAWHRGEVTQKFFTVSEHDETSPAETIADAEAEGWNKWGEILSALTYRIITQREPQERILRTFSHSSNRRGRLNRLPSCWSQEGHDIAVHFTQSSVKEQYLVSLLDAVAKLTRAQRAEDEENLGPAPAPRAYVSSSHADLVTARQNGDVNEDVDEPQRGIMPVSIPQKVLASWTVNVDLKQLPSYQPRVSAAAMSRYYDEEDEA